MSLGFHVHMVRAASDGEAGRSITATAAAFRSRRQSADRSSRQPTSRGCLHTRLRNIARLTPTSATDLGLVMLGTRWIKVDATIVECFRAWGESSKTRHPLFEIVADVKIRSGQVERVTSQQKLRTLTHRWRPPEPGDVVSARWDPAGHNLRLDLGRDARYNEKLSAALRRTRDAGASHPGPTGLGGGTA